MVCSLTCGGGVGRNGDQHDDTALVRDDEADGDVDAGVGGQVADQAQAGRRELRPMPIPSTSKCGHQMGKQPRGYSRIATPDAPDDLI